MNTKQALNSIEEQVLPRAVELEKAILGTIMVEPDALARVFSILNPDCFASEPGDLQRDHTVVLVKQAR